MSMRNNTTNGVNMTTVIDDQSFRANGPEQIVFRNPNFGTPCLQGGLGMNEDLGKSLAFHKGY